MKPRSTSALRGRLKTRHLLLLSHLDRERSVLAAARAAHMTQPGASKLLAELEDSLGVRLFTRHARGIEPTAYGEVMIRHARSALAEMDRAQHEISALASGLSGKCAIGSVVSAGTSLVPKAIVLLKQSYPGILVSVDIDNSDVLVRRLLDGDLDIIVARLSGSDGAPELDFEPLAGEVHSVIARAGHPLVRQARLDMGDLVDRPWILPPAGSFLRNRIDSMFVQRGLGLPRNVVETSSIPVILSLLQNTDMISALQDESLEPYRMAGLLGVLPLKFGVRMEPFGIAVRRGYRLSPAGEAMLRCLRDAAAGMYAAGQGAAKPSSRRKPGGARPAPRRS
jgi:DNA-binding transcriptional LysR family regulator